MHNKYSYNNILWSYAQRCVWYFILRDSNLYAYIMHVLALVLLVSRTQIYIHIYLYYYYIIILYSWRVSVVHNDIMLFCPKKYKILYLSLSLFQNYKSLIILIIFTLNKLYRLLIYTHNIIYNLIILLHPMDPVYRKIRKKATYSLYIPNFFFSIVV